MTSKFYSTTSNRGVCRFLRLSPFDYVVLIGALINLMVVGLIIVHWFLR